MGELRDKLTALTNQLDEFAKLVDVPAKREEVARYETRMGDPVFWDDQVKAQEVVAALKAIKSVLDPYQELRQAVTNCGELLELAEAEQDLETLTQIAADLEPLTARYGQLELRLALGGKHDAANVYLTIKPGAGGTEACDWAEMLFRMYNNYLQRNGYQVEVVDMQPGDEAGLKNCTLAVRGPNAYGYLKSEMGTHRLVRMSPFNADGKRQTSFAAVEGSGACR